MDSHEKRQQPKEETGRTLKTRDSSVERCTTKKDREKSYQGRKSEKSTLSSQKSPFKSKYSSDKQFSRTTFGHSGLSSKSFSRRHIQQNSTTYHAKPKLGKIAKDLKKHPAADNNLTVKKGKTPKRYTIAGIGNGGCSMPEEPLKPSASGTSNMIALDKSGGCGQSPENAPRHRKCYTNSKHAELSKSLKQMTNGQRKDVKVSQSTGNLKKTGTSKNGKHLSADDIQKYIEKEDPANTLDRTDTLLKVTSSTSFQPASKSENQLSTININSSNKTFTIKIQMKKDGATTNLPDPDISKIEINSKTDIEQSKFCSNYFYKGSDNKMNFESSNISGVKILLRGDLLGALNCLFPQLNLVASDVNPRRPALDPNFSYFSDSTEMLTETFALARKLYNDHPKRPKDSGKSFHKEKYHLLSLIEARIISHMDEFRVPVETSNKKKAAVTPPPAYIRETVLVDPQQVIESTNETQNYCKDLLSVPFTPNGNTNDYLKLRNVVSGKEFKPSGTDSDVESAYKTVSKIPDMESSHTIKSSKSEPNMSISTICHNIRRNTSLDSFMEIHKLRTSTPLCKPSKESPCRDLDEKYLNYVDNVLSAAHPERYKQFREIENLIAELEKLTNLNESPKKTPELSDNANYTACGSKRTLYSSVVKSSIVIADNSEGNEVLSQQNTYHEPDIKYGENTVEIKSSIVPIIDYEDEILTSGLSPKSSFKNTTVTESKPICYNLDELEHNITRTLEKLIDESDDPALYSQYNTMQYSNMFNLNNVQNPYIRNHTQNKFNESGHHKTSNNPGLNSLQSRLNFLRTKGRPSDVEQFFNPLAFNTQLAAQFLQQDNVMTSINTTPMDNMNQIFPKSDLTKLNPLNMQYYQQNTGNVFERDLKELLRRYPQIIQNSSSTTPNNITQPSTCTPNLTSTTPFDLSVLYAQLAANKSQPVNLAQSIPKNNTTDENLILNQFIASQNLENMYETNQFQLDYGKQSSATGGMMEQDPFLGSTNYFETGSSGMRTIISVSDLEKQALEQYRNSDESINARYEVLEKEAEEQYNNFLNHKL